MCVPNFFVLDHQLFDAGGELGEGGAVGGCEGGAVFVAGLLGLGESQSSFSSRAFPWYSCEEGLYLAQAGAGGAGLLETAVVGLVLGVRVRVGAGPGRGACLFLFGCGCHFGCVVLSARDG